MPAGTVSVTDVATPPGCELEPTIVSEPPPLPAWHTLTEQSPLWQSPLTEQLRQFRNEDLTALATEFDLVVGQ